MAKNVEAITRLVKALRSGVYKQGHGVLKESHPRTETSYCCEGVACDLVPVEVGEWSGSSFLGHTAFAPVEVGNFYGVETMSQSQWAVRIPWGTGWAETTWRWYGLADLNDSRLTFPQIADLIEWYYLNGGLEDAQAFDRSRGVF